MINFIVWIILGGISGWSAAMIVRTDAQQGILLNIIVGIAGAFLAGLFLTPLFGVSTINQNNFSIASLIVSLVGAIILLLIVNLFRRGSIESISSKTSEKSTEIGKRSANSPKESPWVNKPTVNQPTARSRRIDIFLSYSRRDTDFMRRLSQDLRAEGFSVWIDETNLEPGTPSWQQAVEEAIHAARCVIVILSPEAKQSRWVEIEVTIAEENGIRIIPILARGDTRNAVLFRLISTQRIDMRNEYQAGLKQQLVPALQRYLGN